MKAHYELVLSVALLCVVALGSAQAGASVKPAAAGLEAAVADDTQDGTAEFGSTVDFIYSVRNSGDVTVTAIVCADSVAGDLGVVPELPPGGQATFSAQVELTNSGAGEFTATGRGPDGEVVSAIAPWSIELYFADEIMDLALGLTPSKTSARPGELVRYRIVVRRATGEIPDETTVVDDFDETRMTLADAGGATLSGGRLVWRFIPYGGETRVFDCAFRVKSGAEGLAMNSARVSMLGDPTRGNDAARVSVRLLPPAAESGSTPVSQPESDAERAVAVATTSSDKDGAEPFLPFTGAPVWLALQLAATFGSAGFALRYLGR